MRFAADQWHFKDEFALFLQTCDKSCFHMWGGEKGACVSLRSHNANSLAKCRWSPVKSTISFHPPGCDSNFCHTSAGIMPSWLQMFTGPQRKRHFFTPPRVPEQLFLHICTNNAIPKNDDGKTPAGSILLFAKIHSWIGNRNFCHTSAVIMPSRKMAMVKPQREAYFFSSQIHPWMLTSIWHSIFQGFKFQYPKKH